LAVEADDEGARGGRRGRGLGLARFREVGRCWKGAEPGGRGPGAAGRRAAGAEQVNGGKELRRGG
jgi:hypothetical protein